MPRSHFFQHGVFFLAKGSEVFLSIGYLATVVRVLPKRMLISTEELMAQPLALSTVPRLRLRSFCQARNIDGPLMQITSTSSTINGVYQCEISAASAEVRKPTARPMAAKMPANLAISNAEDALFTAAAPASLSLASAGTLTLPADSVMLLFTLASFSAARLLMRSTMALAKRRYGLQKACLMLSGFSMILVTVASQISPARS